MPLRVQPVFAESAGNGGRAVSPLAKKRARSAVARERREQQVMESVRFRRRRRSAGGMPQLVRLLLFPAVDVGVLSFTAGLPVRA